MISYNHSVINEMFTSFSNIIKTNICIYDNNFECPNIQNSMNRSCCSYINSVIQPQCAHSDSIALKTASTTNTPFSYRCHFGYTEIIIPYLLDNETQIYVLVGPFRNKDNNEEMIQKIKEYCALLHKDEKPAIEKYLETPLYDDLTYKSIITIINAIIDYSQKIKLISVKDNFITSDLDPYLKMNISRNISNSEIANHFYYTNKQLEHIVKKQTGMTPKKYILLFKMNVAKDMLINTDEDLQEIANFVGFSDYNYFIKVFKTFNKTTPLKFRKNFQNNQN